MDFVLATRNRNKIREIRDVLHGLPVSIKTLDDFENFPDPDENADTLEGNAHIKARAVCEFSGMASIADDTGLEVESLGGAPGVRSARYAGEEANAQNNVKKLLAEMSQVSDNKRNARFRCVIALMLPDGAQRIVDGIVNGTITREQKGSDGFGYDPVFRPDGYDRTFAEMTLSEKNGISHRGIAVRKLRVVIEEMLDGLGTS